MKIRLTIWAITAMMLGLLIYQNREFYMAEQHLTLNLFFIHLEDLRIPNLVHVLLFLLVGISLACASLYHERFRMRRKVKAANVAFHSCARQVAELEEASAGTRSENRIKGLFDRFRGSNGQKDNSARRIMVKEDGDMLSE